MIHSHTPQRCPTYPSTLPLSSTPAPGSDPLKQHSTSTADTTAKDERLGEEVQDSRSSADPISLMVQVGVERV